MAATPSVKVDKTFPFKAGTKRWSNRYHFNGGTPADATHWHTLFDNIVAAEKLIYDDQTTIVECFGYAAGSDVPVASKTYATAGTWTTAGVPTPGEVSGLVRFSTAARSSKNHPVYLFKYFHRPWVGGSVAGCDTWTPTQKSAASTYAAAWISGFSDGTITAVLAGPNGATATGHFEEEYVTHRDFPYSPSA